MSKTEGAAKILEEVVRDTFDGKYTVLFTITEEGFQRIELIDDDGNSWQEIECMDETEDKNNFDEIAAMFLGVLYGQANEMEGGFSRN